jgi:hypothetical protein
VPTYVLEGGSSATLPAKPLTIRVQGKRQAEVRLEALQDGVPVPDAISRPGMLLLPRVPAPVEIRVVPTRERTFGSGTVVALSAALEARADPDPERALMSGVDLSGLSQRALLRVEPRGSELKLTALGVVADTPLPALAARARDMARELLGMERVPSGAASPLEVLVDASASIRALALDGAVGAALEVVAGVSRVTSGDEPLTVAVATERATAVTADSIVDLPRAVHEAVLATPLATGFRSRGVAPLAGRDSTSGPENTTARCVVTDGVPADLPPSAPGSRLALVVICTPNAREVLAARAPDTTAWIPVADWDNVPAYEALMADDRALRDAVTGMLRALLPADSPLQSRLSPTVGGIDDDMTNLRMRLP